MSQVVSALEKMRSSPTFPHCHKLADEFQLPREDKQVPIATVLRSCMPEPADWIDGLTLREARAVLMSNQKTIAKALE